MSVFFFNYIYIYIYTHLSQSKYSSRYNFETKHRTAKPKATVQGQTAKPLLSTKPNPAPLLSKLLTKRRTSSLSQTQIQAISQKACKGMTMGANNFNLRPSFHIRAFSLGISQLIYE